MNKTPTAVIHTFKPNKTKGVARFSLAGTFETKENTEIKGLDLWLAWDLEKSEIHYSHKSTMINFLEYGNISSRSFLSLKYSYLELEAEVNNDLVSILAHIEYTGIELLNWKVELLSKEATE